MLGGDIYSSPFCIYPGIQHVEYTLKPGNKKFREGVIWKHAINIRLSTIGWGMHDISYSKEKQSDENSRVRHIVNSYLLLSSFENEIKIL